MTCGTLTSNLFAVYGLYFASMFNSLSTTVKGFSLGTKLRMISTWLADVFSVDCFDFVDLSNLDKKLPVDMAFVKGKKVS